MPDQPASFAEDLRAVLNRHNAESAIGNTPDFILAEYLVECLTILGSAITKRDVWYGINPYPGSGVHVAPEAPAGGGHG